MSLVGGGLIYAGKKVIDISADLIKARALADKPKMFIELYGADGRVVKKVKVKCR